MSQQVKYTSLITVLMFVSKIFTFSPQSVLKTRRELPGEKKRKLQKVKKK